MATHFLPHRVGIPQTRAGHGLVLVPRMLSHNQYKNNSAHNTALAGIWDGHEMERKHWAAMRWLNYSQIFESYTLRVAVSAVVLPGCAP